MKLMKKNKSINTNLKILIAFIFGIIISTTLSYTLAATLVNSKDVYYEDNSGLAVNNVQAAIDGTCTKFSNELNNFLNKIYPVGTIYTSTASTNPSSFLGGTWEAYGKGQTLVGIDGNQTEFNTVGKTGGAKSVSTTLKEANLPSHTHTINHTHTTKASSITDGKAEDTTSTWEVGELVGGVSNYSGTNTAVNSRVDWTKFVTGSGTGLIRAFTYTNIHSHAVSATIPALSTDSISTATSGSTGSGAAFSTSTLQPYITVYMWRRTK